MRVLLSAVAVVGLAASAVAYIHVPPQTLKAMCEDSWQIRALTVKARSVEKGVVAFDVAEVLKDKEKPAITMFRLVARPDTTGAKAALDRLAVGASAVLFSQEYGAGKGTKGYGYLFVDEAAFSVDYNAAGEFWLLLRAEPSLSEVYYGPAGKLPGPVQAVLKGEAVKVPTKAPAKPDDLSIRGLLVEEARRRNSPTYPKTPLPTAWGKPAKGLQAGVRINPAVEIPDAAAVLEVVIRNVDTKPRTFTHLQLGFGGDGVDGTVTGKAEEVVGQFTPAGTRSAAYVSPGDTYPLAEVPLFRPGEGKSWTRPRLRPRPGENRVGVEGVVVRLGSGGKGEDVELSTGYLDVPGFPPKK